MKLRISKITDVLHMNIRAMQEDLKTRFFDNRLFVQAGPYGDKQIIIF